MSPSLDHVFLAMSRGAPEVGSLQAAGFAEGPPNVHPGQGTACRRFFFENGYLEFVWIENQEEVSSEGIEPTGLGDRLGEATAASRIGVCFRLTPDQQEPPVATWPYRPPYLPPGFAILMAGNSSRVGEPLLFFLPPGPASTSPEVDHPNGACSITDVILVLPTDPTRSPELAWLAGSGMVRVERGDREVLKVELDTGRQGERLALEGRSPLELAW